MDMIDNFLRSNDLKDDDNLDALLELADLVRKLVSGQRYSDMERVIRYTVEQGCYEAFSWCVGIVQEEFAREDCVLSDFACELGKSIPDYDGFVAVLQVDFRDFAIDTETVRDKNGEVVSFFNIFVYKTGYDHVRLVSSENFDTKDNDYIQYKLFFTRS